MGGIVLRISYLQCNYNSPFVVVASLFLLLAALNGPTSFNAFADTVIKRINKLSFAVYLLHDHDAISPILWNEWVNLGQYTNSAAAFIFRAVSTWLIVFICGLLTETVLSICRKFLARVFPYNKLISKKH